VLKALSGARTSEFYRASGNQGTSQEVDDVRSLLFRCWHVADVGCFGSVCPVTAIAEIGA